jgi:ankyrin repeat domain-containing protein 50
MPCWGFSLLLTQDDLQEWTSIRIFIRVQWEPFEASFGAIDSSLQHHLEVLLHSTQALQFNAIQCGNRDADLERCRVRQRESGECILVHVGCCIELTLLSAVEERKKFLQWLSGISFDEDHDAIYSKRHAGTGNWFIQNLQFQQWFGSQTSALLWCFGKRLSMEAISLLGCANLSC